MRLTNRYNYPHCFARRNIVNDMCSNAKEGTQKCKKCCIKYKFFDMNFLTKKDQEKLNKITWRVYLIYHRAFANSYRINNLIENDFLHLTKKEAEVVNKYQNRVNIAYNKFNKFRKRVFWKLLESEIINANL